MFKYETKREVVEAAEQFQRAEYWEAVKDIAQEALNEFPRSPEKRDEYIHESVDGSEWIIYTHRNLSVLRFTRNDSAHEELGLPAGVGAYALYQLIAFYAMLADVYEALGHLRPEKEGED